MTGDTATVRDFNRAMVRIYHRARDEAGYTATYFLQMLSQRGGLETAHHLLRAPAVTTGFTALWERSRLDLTVEALVLDDNYRDLFSDEELDAAQRRLAQYGYDRRT